MLEDYPKEITLKNGEKVVLRPMVKEDEQKLLEFFRRLPEEDRLYLKDDVTDARIIKSWVERLNYDHIIPIIAEKEGRIVADATLHRRTTEQPTNIGEIRIVTDKDFRRVGLGTMLAKELYYLALRKKMNKLVAEVVEDRTAVMKTFEYLGFQKEMTLKDKAVDLRDKKHNLVVMIQDVDALWITIQELIDKDVAHHSRS